jgi:hypothetical protein
MKIEDNDNGTRFDHYREGQLWSNIVLLIAVITFAVLAFIAVSTWEDFIPTFRESQEELRKMDAEMDSMQQDLTRISEAVEAWPGITDPEISAQISRSMSVEAELNRPGPTEPEPIETYDSELARIVSLECDGSYEGALAVATVIYNRLDDGRWGDTIHAVVSAKNQFSVYGSSKKMPLTDTVKQACIDAYYGKRNLPASVMWFCTPGHYRGSSFFQGLKVYARFAGTVWCEASHG